MKSILEQYKWSFIIKLQGKVNLKISSSGWLSKHTHLFISSFSQKSLKWQKTYKNKSIAELEIEMGNC